MPHWSPLMLLRGPSTRSAESMGIRTPPHFCRGSGPSFWPSALVLYGAPYVALVVVSASSAAAVVTRLSGSAFAHADMVIALASGDEKIAANPALRTRTTTRAMTNSL